MKSQNSQVVTTHGDEVFRENQAISSFLALLENDISSGQHLGNLPYDLLQAIFATLTQQVDLAIDVEAAVAL